MTLWKQEKQIMATIQEKALSQHADMREYI
jgi:hypothetical protein